LISKYVVNLVIYCDIKQSCGVNHTSLDFKNFQPQFLFHRKKERKKMKKIKNITLAIILTTFLTLSMLSSLTIIQPAIAHSPALSIPTYAFCNVAPNPAGIGQSVNVGFWISLPPPTANGPYGDRWAGMTVKVTQPDGTTQSLGPFTSDDTGGSHAEFTPTQVGNYTFQMTFPGQTLAGNNLAPGQTNAFIGDHYEPSTSSVATLTVQQESVPNIPQAPLPTNYWSRPIESVNNNWYSISGNWLGLGQLFLANTGMYNATGNYNPYSTAPTTSHILWTKPEAFGGLIGGEFGGDLQSNYYSTREYERMFAPVIMQGILYYTEYPGSTTSPTAIVAVNLQTGQTLWRNDGSNYGGGSPIQSALTSSGVVTVLRCGQIIDYVSPNQYGGLAYLWTTGTPVGINTSPGTTTYNMFDALTGTYILSIVNGTGLTLTTDQSGDLIGYYVDSSNPSAPTLNEWNSTWAIINYGLKTGLLSPFNPVSNIWTWKTPQGGVIPFSDGKMWTVPLATNISGVPISPTLSIGSWGNGIDGPVNSGVIFLWAPSSTGLNFYQAGSIVEACYSTDTGEQLWVANRTEAPYTRVDFMPISNGVLVEVDQTTSACTGYNVNTGARLWGPITLPDANPYNSIGSYYGQVANGVLYITGFGGNIYALNIHDGTILWKTTTTTLHGDAGSDSPYGVWPVWAFGNQGAIADGLLFLGEGHEYSPPLFRGARQLAINITNGQLVWSISAFNVNGGTAISDGIMVCESAYDNQIYAYGKGASAITVTAPSVGITTATPITITGTIIDTSAGTQEEAQKANFPYGVPCVSDASMTPFMEALYMQQPIPNNVTGVPIVLSVLDANGNYRTIGTATSDATGTFALNWTPNIQGAYTVYATFAGSESYYSSNAAAHFYAAEPAATPTPQPTQPASMADLYFVPGIIGIIVAIIVVGAVIILALRKRP
jgi:hypothetical protein